MNEPEKYTSGETASKEGYERGDENGGPDWNAATEVSAVPHRAYCREFVSLLEVSGREM